MPGRAGGPRGNPGEVEPEPDRLGSALPHALTLDVEHDGNHIVLDGGAPDPLRDGFVLTGGMLAVLPKKVRLTHEDADGRIHQGDEPPPRQQQRVL